MEPTSPFPLGGVGVQELTTDIESIWAVLLSRLEWQVRYAEIIGVSSTVTGWVDRQVHMPVQ